MNPNGIRSIAAILFLISAYAQANTPDAAAALVQAFNDSTVGIIDETTSDPFSRDTALRDLLLNEMAMSYLSDLLLGSARTQVTEEQLAAYRAVFPDYMAAQYAGQLVELASQRFELGEAIERRPGQWLVQSEYVTGSGERIDVDWRVIDRDGRLRIADASVQGVSKVLLDRRMFTEVVEQRGISGLIEELIARTSGTSHGKGVAELRALPEVAEFCRVAQRVVTRTDHAVELVIHDAFEAFTKSKAEIDGPTIHQYVWYQSSGRPLAISCKLKAADHLNIAAGRTVAGPDGLCQDMNRQVVALARDAVTDPSFDTIRFDPEETVFNRDEPGRTGPDWLAPFEPVSADANGLLVRAKGFRVDFADPRFADASPLFRGIHYCHFVAPDYVTDVLSGTADPGQSAGAVVTGGAPPAGVGGP